MLLRSPSRTDIRRRTGILRQGRRTGTRLRTGIRRTDIRRQARLGGRTRRPACRPQVVGSPSSQARPRCAVLTSSVRKRSEQRSKNYSRQNVRVMSEGVSTLAVVELAHDLFGTRAWR